MKNSFYGKISLNIKTLKIIRMFISMDYLIILNNLSMKMETITISKHKLLTMLLQFQSEMLLPQLLHTKVISIKEYKFIIQFNLNLKKRHGIKQLLFIKIPNDEISVIYL